MKKLCFFESDLDWWANLKLDVDFSFYFAVKLLVVETKDLETE